MTQGEFFSMTPNECFSRLVAHFRRRWGPWCVAVGWLVTACLAIIVEWAMVILSVLIVTVLAIHLVIRWAGKGMVRRCDLPAAQERAIWMPAPNPDKPFGSSEATNIAHAIFNKWDDWPPPLRTGHHTDTQWHPLYWYLCGTNEIARAEAEFDRRLGLRRDT